MAQGRNANREGARSNELYQLQALNRIVSAITGGGIPSPTGLATETTLAALLAATIAGDQDIEILLVRDKGNADLVVQQITNYETGTPVISYKDVNGNPYVPVGPLEYLDPSAVMNLILTAIQAQGTVPQATEATQLLVDTSTSTLATPVTALAVGMARYNGIGTIGSGKRRVSFYNSGGATATVALADLLPGEVVTFAADGLRDVLAAIPFDATGTDLLTTTIG